MGRWAWWGDGAVVTRSGGLSRVSGGYTWRVLYLRYVSFNELDLILGFSWQIRRTRDALGLWGPPGAGKAVGVGDVNGLIPSVTSYRIPVWLEGLVRGLLLSRAGIAEGLRSGRYVGLCRDGLLNMPGPGKWP